MRAQTALALSMSLEPEAIRQVVAPALPAPARPLPGSEPTWASFGEARPSARSCSGQARVGQSEWIVAHPAYPQVVQRAAMMAEASPWWT